MTNILLIKINSLLDWSLMNFTKTEIVDDSTQYYSIFNTPILIREDKKS